MSSNYYLFRRYAAEDDDSSEGRWVTVNGHPVFISDDNAGSLDDRLPKGLNVERETQKSFSGKDAFYNFTIKGDPQLDDEGKVVGNASIDLKEGVISHMFLNPKYRKQGIGSAMITEAEKKLKEYGFNKPKIAIANDDIILYYQKRGYKITDERYMTYRVMSK